MRRFLFLLVAIGAFVSGVRAQRMGVYRFDQTLEEESGKLPALRPLGQPGAYREEKLPELKNAKRTVYAFEQNSGLQFDNRAANGFLGGSYTIEIYFRFLTLDSWKRVIDFKNRKSDNGCYIYDGKLNFYNFITGAKAPVHPNEYTHYVVSRDAKTQQLKMYVDGESKVEFTDKFDQGVIDDDGVLNFFFDDLIVKEEASEGAVAMIKIYDYVVDPSTIKSGYLMLNEGINKSITVNTPPVIAPELPAPAPPVAPPATEKSKSYTNFEEKAVAIGTSIVLNNIRFVQSKAELLPESDAELNHLWEYMREHPTTEIELQGHTDNQGDFDLNLALSKQRVEAVKAFLVSKGISPQRISGRGFGSTRPIANNNREETRRLNRRVELVIKKF